MEFVSFFKSSYKRVRMQKFQFMLVKFIFSCFPPCVMKIKPNKVSEHIKSHNQILLKFIVYSNALDPIKEWSHCMKNTNLFDADRIFLSNGYAPVWQ